MVTTLVACGKHSLVGRDDVILQFAHGLEFEACGLAEFSARAAQGTFGRGRQLVAVFVEEVTQHAQRGNLGKGVEKGRGVARNDVEVAVSGLDESREQTGAVYAFARGEYGVQIVEVVDYEVERFQAPVGGGIHEVDHFHAVVYHKVDEVLAGDVFRIFFEVFQHTVVGKCRFVHD